MTAYPLISSDSHVVEPPDLWTSRIQGQFKDRAPRLVQEADCDRWYVDEHINAGSYGVLVDAGKRFEAPETIRFEGRFESVPPGGYDPDAHVKDMDVDGVAVDILYPSVGLRLFRMPDSQLMSATFRAYNDWLAEFCAAHPQRLKGIAMVNVDDAQEGIGELQRAARAGLAGAMISVYPREDQQYDQPMYEPFWAAAQDLDMPLSLHVATNRPGAGGLTTDTLTSQTAAARANTDYWVRMSLANMMFAGIFERYPRLQVGAVEHELAWVPFFLSQMDFVYRERQQQARVRFKDGMQPSDFFHRNVFLGFQEDGLGIRDRALIGVDNLMWGSDYPHAESTWPRSRQVLEAILEGVPEAERQKIAGANAARVYHLA
jgi:predicted TIM-barrel fold metal-dependent hydrolase